MLAFCFEGAEVAVGIADAGKLDRLEVPTAAIVAGGEFWSRSGGARGTAPADGLLGVASSTAARFQNVHVLGLPLFCRKVAGCLGPGDGDFWSFRPAKGPGTYM